MEPTPVRTATRARVRPLNRAAVKGTLVGIDYNVVSIHSASKYRERKGLTIVRAEKHREEGNHPPVLCKLDKLLEFLLSRDGILDLGHRAITTDDEIYSPLISIYRLYL